MSVRFERTAPVLRIFSVEKAMEFYLGFLAFTLDWDHRFEESLPLYASVSRAGLTLHLSEHHGDACPGAAVFVTVAGLDAFHAELGGKSYRYARPGLQLQPWGRVMSVTDPFGNRLHFCEPPNPGTGPAAPP